MAFIDFLIHNKWIILFYLVILAIVIINRKKFEFQAKFIALYKTKIGIPFMQKFADKYGEVIRIFGYMAMGIGFVGMLVITAFMIQGIYTLLFQPSAPAVLSPFIPGVQIPGSPLKPPFWESIIALFIVVVVHEGSHGVVSKLYKIPIKNTGIVFFGPLIGAFVEPDEKKLEKQSDIVKHSIFAAGPFSNVLLAVVVALLLLLIINPLQSSMTTPSGFTFSQVQEGYPAASSGLQPNIVYDSINGKPIKTIEQMYNELQCIMPNQSITISNANASYSFVTAANPQNPERGYLGIMNIQEKQTLKSDTAFNRTAYAILHWLQKLFEWIIIISLGIGLANLLPIGPVDGGRMLHTALTTAMGKERGHKAWARISIIGVIVIVILLFVPIIKAII
ncbi:hypothetical protein C4573_03400 [Candidatus Woesearchaeota archaeon]|nr:MAG: hypothetical protein C4573_03400 [Candidatus Woesearchaeota archaeon]